MWQNRIKMQDTRNYFTLARVLHFALFTIPIFGALSIHPENILANTFTRNWETHFERPGVFKLSPELNFYNSTSNYNHIGQNTSPNGLTSYHRFAGQFTFAIGLHEYFTPYASLSWNRTAVQHSRFVGNQFGLADQSLGFTSRIWKSQGPPSVKKVSLDLQAQLDFPLYNNSVSLLRELPFLGDGSFDILSGAIITIPFTQNKERVWEVRTGAAYVWRSSGFSQAFPWSVEVRHEPQRQGLIFGLILKGTQSLRTDTTLGPDAAFPNNASIVTSGGSFFVNAINPSFIQTQAHLGYQAAENLRFGAFAGSTLWGQATPLFVYGGIKVELSSQALDLKPSQQTAKDYGKSNAGFVNYAFEAKVTKVNDRLNVLKIDKGSQDSVSTGQIFDIFLVRPDGSIGEAIARAQVTDVKIDEAALRIEEYFKEVWIEEGFVAKRPLQ